MNETNEQIVTDQKPAWLELPDLKSYWHCQGTLTGAAIETQNQRWIGVYYTKEEAEASAFSNNCDDWVWDRKGSRCRHE